MVLNLLFLPPGLYLESCLEESRGWAAAAGWCCISTGVAIGNVDGVHGFVSLGVDPTPLRVPSWDIPTAALLTSVSWAPAALALLAYSCFEVVRVGWSVGADALHGDGRSGQTLALRVNAKLGTLDGIRMHPSPTSS